MASNSFKTAAEALLASMGTGPNKAWKAATLAPRRPFFNDSSVCLIASVVPCSDTSGCAPLPAASGVTPVNPPDCGGGDDDATSRTDWRLAKEDLEMQDIRANAHA